MGVLIDKTGIYLNNDFLSDELNGWMSWSDFKSNGHIVKIGSYDVQLCDDPDIGINVSGCSLSQADAIRFFKGLLALVCGDEA